MAEIKNTATISITFYHSSGDTSPECLIKKYILKNWQDEVGLRQLLDQIAKELNYISGFGISEIKVKSELFDFKVAYKNQCKPYQVEKRHDIYVTLFGFQEVLRFQIGHYERGGGNARLDVPRLRAGVMNTWGALEPSDHLLQIRIIPIGNRKEAKRRGTDYSLFFNQENSVLLSFLNRISTNGGLEPVTSRAWYPNSQLAPTGGYILLCQLPKAQTTEYKRASEEKKKNLVEKKRLKRENSGIVYKDRKNTKKADQVYLIKMDNGSSTGGVYKIGISNAPGRRLKSLSTSSPFELLMVHRFVAEPAEDAEKQLHALFKDARMKGEWFDLTPDQVNEIKMITGFENGLFLKKTHS